jgi:nucleoside-diphosphate-sugar epimerase
MQSVDPLIQNAQKIPPILLPQTAYGWEKLSCERVYKAYMRNYGIEARIARYHNIFGPEGSWNDGKEKAPAALCRKVAMSEDGTVEIWGDGKQTRSFLFVDECLEGTIRLMRSSCSEPVNIGSEEMVTIDQLVDLIADIPNKKIEKRHIPGPLGVRGRKSDNRLITEKLGWAPSQTLREGLVPTYNWIDSQISTSRIEIPGLAKVPYPTKAGASGGSGL